MKLKIEKLRKTSPRLTELFKHLVTLVQDKVLYFARVELLLPYERHHSAGCTDNNVWALFLVVENLLVGRDGGTTVEYTGSDVGHEF